MKEQEKLEVKFDLDRFGDSITDDLTPEELEAEVEREAKAHRPKFFSAGDLLRRGQQELPTLIDPIFPKVGLISIAGSSDTGKSSLLRHLAICVSSKQKEFLGFPTNFEHHHSVYVSTEDDDRAISYLLYKNNQRLNLPDSAYDNCTFIFDTSNLLENLNEFLQKQAVDVIIIDAFTDLYGNSLNDSNQVRTFLNEYSQLAQKFQCLVIFLHHARKRSELDPPSKHNVLGSQGFEAKMRLVIELRKDPGDPSLRHFCVVKGNYLSEEYKGKSFAFRFTDSLTFERTDIRTSFHELVEKKEGSEEREARDKKIIKLSKDEGLSQREIASEVGCSPSTVNTVINRFRNPK